MIIKVSYVCENCATQINELIIPNIDELKITRRISDNAITKIDLIENGEYKKILNREIDFCDAVSIEVEIIERKI